MYQVVEKEAFTGGAAAGGKKMVEASSKPNLGEGVGGAGGKENNSQQSKWKTVEDDLTYEQPYHALRSNETAITLKRNY